MNTKFILHGGFTGVLNKQNRMFMKEIIKDIPAGGQVLIVYFARDDKEYPRLAKRDKDFFDKVAGEKKIRIKIADKKNFIEQIKSSAAIYLSGGDTEKLLDELKKYPEFKDAIKGKTVVGSSAGAYALAKYYHSNSRGGISKGLGIIPAKVVCHFKSKKFVSKDNPIALMKNYPADLELVVLKDFEFKVINK